MLRFLIAVTLSFALSSCASLRYYDNAGIGRRPHAWCGWWLRQHVGSDPGPAFNIARKWARWGSPANGPGPDVIGVQRHHVFKVIQDLGHGLVLAISGNDGHAVRTRVRSTRHVIAWRRA